MKTRTMEKELRYQYHRLVNCEDKKTDNDWEYIYTLKNILEEVKDFRSTQRVLDGLNYLVYVYNDIIKNFEDYSKKEFEDGGNLGSYALNKYHICCRFSNFETVKKNLEQRVGTINAICQIYMTDKDTIKKFKLESL